MTPPPRTGWTLAIVSIALFMVTLDNLVVTTALPSIRADLGASLEALEWTVNAYTLAFAVLPAHRRRARRPLRPPAHVRRSASASSPPPPPPPRSRRRTDALIAARALQGARRRDRRAAHADAAHRGVPGREARPGARRLVGRQRPRRRARPAGRRRGRRGHLVAVDLLAQRADRPRARSRSPLRAPERESYGPARRLDLPRPRRSPAPACSASCSASSAARRWAGRARRSLGSLAAGVVAARRVRRLGAPRRRRRCCRCASSARARSRPPTACRWRCSSASSARSSCSPSSSRSSQGYSPLEAGLRTLPWTGDADVRRADRRAALATGSARGR